MSSFVVANAILIAFVAAYLIGMSANGLRLGFLTIDELEKTPNYTTTSALLELTLNPVVCLLGLICLVITNAVLFSKGRGIELTKAKYGWGGLMLCILAFVAAMVPALMVPLVDYMNSSTKEFKEMGYGFRALVVIRLLLAVLFLVAGIMVLKS